MNKNLFFILFLIIMSLKIYALKAYLGYASFFAPDNGPYIETYLSIEGNSVKYKKNKNGKFQSAIEITLSFKQNENIKNFKKYVLLSPEINDTIKNITDFIDLQRFLLPNGTYEFEIIIKDKYNDNEKPFKTSQVIEISYPESKINISDIELLESIETANENNIYVKSGYKMIPYPSFFYGKNMQKIYFYAEIYNTEDLLGKEEPFLTEYYIEDLSGNIISRYYGFTKQKSNKVNVVLSSFDISKLKSGIYNLIISVKNKEAKVVALKKVSFERYNPGIDIEETNNNFFVKDINKDTLLKFIYSLRPIAIGWEINFIDNEAKKSDINILENFFYSFWKKRDTIDPLSAWNKYYDNVKEVNKFFSTPIKKGYETDRGRVYLMYGAPNTITKRYNEPGTYPYEIWHYYKIGNFTNKRFVFYSRELASNDFELIHSDMQGEINNFRWKMIINKRTDEPKSIDSNEPRNSNSFGNELNQYYENPR